MNLFLRCPNHGYIPIPFPSDAMLASPGDGAYSIVGESRCKECGSKVELVERSDIEASRIEVELSERDPEYTRLKEAISLRPSLALYDREFNTSILNKVRTTFKDKDGRMMELTLLMTSEAGPQVGRVAELAKRTKEASILVGGVPCIKLDMELAPGVHDYEYRFEFWDAMVKIKFVFLRVRFDHEKSWNRVVFDLSDDEQRHFLGLISKLSKVGFTQEWGVQFIEVTNDLDMVRGAINAYEEGRRM